MNKHNFKIIGGDTDSIMFCKPDMSLFSKDEQASLLQEINSLLPKEIKFANDGIFSKVLYLKSKNYIMIDEKGKRKIKGSSLKSATLEPILKLMLGEFIESLISDEPVESLQAIYTKYIKMSLNIPDIKPWGKKMSLSPTTFNSTRRNETKVIDAIKGSEYVSGDRIYVYSRPDDTLQLVERFDGEYDVDKYLVKLYKTTERFETILPVKELFPNFALKKNKKLLEELK